MTAQAAPNPRAATASKNRPSEDETNKIFDRELLRRMLPFVRPHARMLAASMLLLPMMAGMVAIRPRIMKWALDEGIGRRDVSVIDRAALLYLAIVAVEFVLRFVQVYAMQVAGARAMADLRVHVFSFLQRAKVAYFDEQPVGRLVTRVTNDIDTLGELFASGALNAIGDLFALLLIVLMMLLLDARLTGIALLTLPPLWFVVRWIRVRAREAFRNIRTHTARLNTFLGEQVQGVGVVQAYHREARSQQEFDVENRAYLEANRQAILYDSTLDAIVEGVSIACAALLLWFIGFRGVQLGQAVVTFGTFVAFLQYLEQFFVPIRDLTSRYTLLQSAMAGAERIFELLDTPDLADAAQGTASTEDGDRELAIEFADVTFSYKPGTPVLEHIDLRARRGERIALVGATGSGKSTIASLALRLYERDSGAIRVFGRDVRAWQPAELRRRFAVVPQDVHLFPGTILDNVALGDEQPDRARAERALARISALDLFAARPGGLEAKIGDRGTGLSAGERQLVAFARALYRDPEVLILDEATANIDSNTEARLQRALEVVLEGRTALVIAHRLSTIRQVDRIVVLHRGKVVEEGTHDELVARGGVFARLYELQFARPAPIFEERG